MTQKREAKRKKKKTREENESEKEEEKEGKEMEEKRKKRKNESLFECESRGKKWERGSGMGFTSKTERNKEFIKITILAVKTC